MKEQRLEINAVNCLDKEKMLSHLIRWKANIIEQNKACPSLYDAGAVKVLERLIENVASGYFDKKETSFVVLAVRGCEIESVIYPQNETEPGTRAETG